LFVRDTADVVWMAELFCKWLSEEPVATIKSAWSQSLLAPARMQTRVPA